MSKLDKLMIANEWYEERLCTNGLDAQSENDLKMMDSYWTRISPEIKPFNLQQETNSPVPERIATHPEKTKITISWHASKFINRLKGRTAKWLQPYHYSVINDDASNFTYNHAQNQLLMHGQSRFSKLRQWIREAGIQLLEAGQFSCKAVPVIQPEAQLKFVWDIYITSIRVFLFLMFTVEISFANNLLYDQLLVPLLFCLSCLMLDILLQFNTAYFEQGQIVSNRSQIIMNYVTTDLLMDTISVATLLSITLVQVSNNSRFIPCTEQVHLYAICQTSQNLSDVLQFVVVFQIRNIFRVTRKIEEGLHFSKFTITMLDLAKLILVVVSFEHLFSCIWYYVGRQAYLKGQDSWIGKADIGTQGYSKQYLYSFYFASVTMISVGYGDIVPINDSERVVAIVFMFCSCIQLSYSVTSLFGIITQLNQQSAMERVKLRSINLYMQKKRISQQLQVKVREYLSYVWQEQSNEDDSHLETIGQLSQQIREDLMLEANSLVLKGCRLFADHFSPQFKKKTLKIIRSLTLYPDISLESQLNDDRDNFLFFIESGQIRVEYGANANGQQNPKMTSIALLAEGQHFGLEGFITGLPSWETYKSIGFTQLLYIQRSEFMAILREYPDDYEQFCNLKDSAHDLVTCYSCHSKKHSVQHCPMVHYVPDQEGIIKRWQFDHRQRRRLVSGSRVRFTKFSARMDQEFINEVAEAFQFCHEQLIETLYEVAEDAPASPAMRMSMARGRLVLPVIGEEAKQCETPESKSRSVSYKRQSKMLDQLRPMIRGSKRKSDLQDVVSKLKNAVVKINHMRRFSATIKDQMLLKRLKPADEMGMLVPKSIGNSGPGQDQSAAEHLILKKRLVVEDGDRHHFSNDFELHREFGIYKPQNNCSSVVQVIPKSKLQLFAKWSRYLLYPWTYINRYTMGQPPAIKVSQSRKKTFSKYSILRSKVHPERRADRRTSKAFTLIEKRFKQQ